MGVKPRAAAVIIALQCGRTLSDAVIVSNSMCRIRKTASFNVAAPFRER